MSAPSVDVMRVMFTQVNADCAATGESVVPFTDTEYYSHQIQALYDVSPTTALALAKQLERRKEER